jgi:hypothetical protein
MFGWSADQTTLVNQALATFFSLLFLGIVFIAIPWGLSLRLTPETKRGRIVRWLLSWSIKGLLVPLALWATINLGLSWNLQPFMPEVQAARNRGGNWGSEFLRVAAIGLIIISSYWSAITLGWLLTSATRASEEASRKDFKILALTCLLGLGLPAALIVFLGGLPVAGLAATLMLAPMVGYSREILRPRKPPPMYSRAVARIKFGKYTEAEWEIIKELENWEDDFEGWMMLADLYAHHFNDLAEAEQTILELCNQPKLLPSQFSVALHRLADWHLKLAGEPDGARRALQMVCERLPGTHLAHMAQLRINQLPATAADLREQQTARPIPLPALGDQLDTPPAPAPPGMDRKQAAKLANSCVEQLKRDPNNVGARERLARIFAEHLERAPLGIEQILLLLNMPDRSDAERAEWLGLVAAWHIKYCRDTDAGRNFLDRLIREFPESPQAFAARRRLELLDRELKKKPQ